MQSNMTLNGREVLNESSDRKSKAAGSGSGFNRDLGPIERSG